MADLKEDHGKRLTNVLVGTVLVYCIMAEASIQDNLMPILNNSFL